MKGSELITEGLDDYADKCEDEAKQQALEAAEIREIQEDIAMAEYDVWLRDLDDRQLCDAMVGPNTQLTFERQLTEMNRRIDEWDCEAEREQYGEEDDDESY
jgi:hypothetical protein